MQGKDNCNHRLLRQDHVKDMISAVLGSKYQVVKTQGNLNNDIGCPLSLLRIAPDTEFAIIEMGASHAGEIAQLCRIAQPDESAVTLVAPAHLEGFGSIEMSPRQERNCYRYGRQRMFLCEYG